MDTLKSSESNLIISDIKNQLSLLKIHQDKINQITSTLELSLFYFNHADILSQIFSPLENESVQSYKLRLKSINNKSSVQKLLLLNPKIKSITFFKHNELVHLYSSSINVQLALQNKCKMPFELIAHVFIKAKEKGTLVDFFNNAFRDGCIAIRLTKISSWAEKNII